MFSESGLPEMPILGNPPSPGRALVLSPLGVGPSEEYTEMPFGVCLHMLLIIFGGRTH